MRAVVQRVSQGSVTVDGTVSGSIERGLLVYLGVGQSDTHRDVEFIADKVVHLRIFESDEGKMNLSVKDSGGGILLISQFTLYGECRKGRRPDFTAAGAPEKAKRIYEDTITAIKEKGVPVETGVFASHMDIHSINDGPLTLVLESPQGA